ncbi:MAG: oxidoreductase [Paenibacillaceae bacterium]|jgi:predicted dehydrogenase|nr:oxidoreductase [Paenibacillaceae bacterium]
MSQMNAVIIGCGAIGPIHAAAIAQAADVQLYGVCDIIEERARALAEKYGCRSFTDLEQVLADEAVDSVHICTPHFLHAEMTARAARAGKHIVLEKPVAMSVAQARTAAEAVKAAGVSCCAILQNRLNPSVEKAKQLIEDGTYGKLLGIKGFLTWKRTAEYYQSESWRGKWETEGGGLLINQAVHMLDMLHYLGGAVQAVKGNIDTRVLEDIIEVEDTADATIYYEDGKVGLFYATNGHSMNSPFFVELHMEKGLLRYIDDQLIYKGEAGDEQLASDVRTTLGKSYWGIGHARLIADFYRSLAGGDASYSRLQDAACSMGMLDAIYASSRNRRKQAVELF